MATRGVEAFRADVRARWGPVITDLGTHNCRRERNRDGSPVAGNEWSQHAYCDDMGCGNAWDFRVPASVKDEVHAFLDSHPAVRYVIDYGDGQFHVDAKPKMTGTPSCAGGGGGQPGTGSDTPDVLNPPTEGGTAKVPAGPTPPGMEDIESGIREGSAADKALSPLDSAKDVLAALGDPSTWGRVLLVVAGLAALAIGAVILVRDLIPAGRLAGAAAGAVEGATS